MSKPILLDLFCGAGGASKGFANAGFEVVGVDIESQPHYPFEFIQADALSFSLEGFDAVHASPPCQRYSSICRGMGIADDKPNLLGKTRDKLIDSGLSYSIENVSGAPFLYAITLCGSMFGLRSDSGLWLRRHRLFELSFLCNPPQCRHEAGLSIGVYGNGTNNWHRKKLGRNITVDEQRQAMGINWMPRKSLTQAIPPAYTEWIGRQLLDK